MTGQIGVPPARLVVRLPRRARASSKRPRLTIADGGQGSSFGAKLRNRKAPTWGWAVDGDARIFHPTYVRLLCLHLREHGVAPADALAGSGLTWRQLQHEKRLVGFATMRTLALNAKRLTGQPALGLAWGLAIETAAHGVTGAAIAASRDVGEALRAAASYRPLRGRSATFELRPRRDGLLLVIHEPFALGEVRSFILEAHAGIIARFLASVAGAPLTGVEYRFPYAPPAWAAAYARKLAGTVRFRAARMAVHVPSRLLALPGMLSDAGSRGVIAASAERELALQRDGDWVGRVRQHLLDDQGGYPTVETVARKLNVSVRTLLRRLKDEGASYQGLLDAVRQDVARWYLAETSQTVEAIATRLGYADPSNFSRSFRRWFGVPPAAFRRQGRAGR